MNRDWLITPSSPARRETSVHVHLTIKPNSYLSKRFFNGSEIHSSPITGREQSDVDES
jgi:hypothetical protein